MGWMEDRTPQERGFIRFAWIVIGAIGLWAIVAYESRDKNVPPVNHPSGYKLRMCDPDPKANYDFRNSKEASFDVPLKEGCFGNIVYLPKWWKDWHTQPKGELEDYWNSFWYLGDVNPLPAVGANNDVAYDKPLSNPFRLQGHGIVHFYTNDLPGAKVEKPIDPNARQPVSRISLDSEDSHLICSKPDDAYFAEVNKTVKGGVDGDGVPPEFRGDYSSGEGAQSSDVTWANGFKGRVDVCFMVDEKGKVSDINFPTPPPSYIIEHVSNRVSAWEYKGAFIPHDNERKPIKTVLAFVFEFR